MSFVSNIMAGFRKKQDAVREQKLVKSREDAERAEKIIKQEKELAANRAKVQEARSLGRERRLGPLKNAAAKVRQNFAQNSKQSNGLGSVFTAGSNSPDTPYYMRPQKPAANPYTFTREAPKKKAKRGRSVTIRL